MISLPYQRDTQKIIQSFNNAAASYDNSASLQQTCGFKLMTQINSTIMNRIVDLGSGTGWLTNKLASYSKQSVVAIDIAHNMLNHAQQKYNSAYWICSDAHHLPLQDKSCDLVFSNMTFQWCANLNTVLQECQRILTAKGKLLFSIPGPNTLRELRLSWQQVDNFTHVNAFQPANELYDLLLSTGWQSIKFNIEHVELEFNSVIEIMYHLKNIGARNFNRGRPLGLNSKYRLDLLEKYYEKFRNNSKMLPVSYEIIYISATR